MIFRADNNPDPDDNRKRVSLKWEGKNSYGIFFRVDSLFAISVPLLKQTENTFTKNELPNSDEKVIMSFWE